MVYLKDYIKKDQILFLESSSKNDTLEELLASVKEKPFVADYEALKKAVYAREEIMSTGIGFSVALPHVKIKEVKEFFIVVGIHKDGVNWDSLDGKPVHEIFFIAGPEDHQQYLRIVAKLTLIIKNPKVREQVFKASSADEIFDIFQAY